MVRHPDEYGQEDEDSGVYDEEDDMADDQPAGEDEMQMQIHPDLIAAAHKMGVELDSEQIQELQKFIEQQNIDIANAEESEGEQEEGDMQSSPEHHHVDEGYG